MRFKLSLLIIIIILCRYRGFTQEVHFTAVELPKEAAWSGILAMTQDSQGYLWLASKEGVYKYDGHQYTVYQHETANPNSLSLNWVESIFAGKHGIIWIGTFGGGLDRFDPATNTFTHYRHQPGNASSIANDKVTTIICDHDGVMWLGTFNGLDRFDSKTSTFKHFVYNKKDPHSLSDNLVRAVYEDKQGTIWVGTGSPFPSDDPNGEGGLNKLDKKTGKFTRYLHDAKDQHSLIDNSVRAIFEDSRGTFWVGTAGDGLHTMDREKGIFQRHPCDPAHPENLSRPPIKNTLGYAEDHITFINEDRSGKIWIGTFEGGINVYDPATQKTTFYGTNSKGKEKLNEDDYWCSYKSRDGIFWVSAWAGVDLYKISPYQNKLPYYYMGHVVRHIAEARDNALWIATGKELICQDKNNKQKIFYFKDAVPRAKGIPKTEEDDKKDTWIPNGGDGMLRFNYAHNEFTSYHHQAGNTNSLMCDTLFNVPRKDPRGNIWIPTNRGLDEMNIKTGLFRHILHRPNDPNSISNDLVNDICVDKNDAVWVSTADGIDRLDQRTMRFRKYLPNILVYTILSDSHGNLWLGTDYGLYKYDSRSDKFSPFGKDKAQVFGIMEGRENDLWLEGDAGLTNLHLQSGETTVYGGNQGLHRQTLLSACVMHDGKVLLGDTGGYFAFYPDKLLHSAPPSTPVITYFLLADAAVTPSAGGILSAPLFNAKEIRLNHRQTTFSFGFTSIDFVSDDAGVRTFYMLEGYDTKWRKGSSDQIANYYNVPPGKYIFKVKSINSNGLSNEKSIAVIISPPWWQRWWAYAVFILAFAGSIWAFIYYRSLSLLRDKRILEHKVHLRTEEVLQQKEEIEAQRDNLEQAIKELKVTQSQLVQSEKLASLGELTAGIAHEIQNPLNFVNNFAEVSVELVNELKEEHEKEKRDIASELDLLNNLEQNLEKITQHGKRADAIVKNMLQHSRYSNSERNLTDINALADEYFRLSYHGLRAKDKSFNATMTTHFDENLPKINLVPQDIGRVLLNLYNNAFYAVTDKKKTAGADFKPEVTVTTSATKGYVIIKVADNGNGIPDSIRDKIMQPFFTTKPTGEGTGLGLSLSYDMVAKGHSGTININSKEGEYTELTIQLPI